MAEENDRPDLILRSDGKVVGVMSRSRRKRELPKPVPIPEPRRRTPREIIIAIAHKIVGSTVQVDEETANIQALEKISEAAARLDRNTRMVQKPQTRGGLHRFLKRKSRIGG